FVIEFVAANVNRFESRDEGGGPLLLRIFSGEKLAGPVEHGAVHSDLDGFFGLGGKLLDVGGNCEFLGTSRGKQHGQKLKRRAENASLRLAGQPRRLSPQKLK